MSYILLSDKPVEGYAEFLTEAINELSKYNVRGIAIVAMLDQPPEENVDAMTGYWNMSLRDKEAAIADIQSDVTAQIVRANLRIFLEELEREDEENGQDEV